MEPVRAVVHPDVYAAMKNAEKAATAHLGPVKWCKQCSRYHQARAACNFYHRTRETPIGQRKVWAR